MDILASRRNIAVLRLSTTSQHAPYTPLDATLRRAKSRTRAHSNGDSRVQQNGESLPYVLLYALLLDALRHVSSADQPLPELSLPELLFSFPLPLHKQPTRNSQLQKTTKKLRTIFASSPYMRSFLIMNYPL
jgi:hypothetical protein